jgi:hypothetical protein
MGIEKEPPSAEETDLAMEAEAEIKVDPEVLEEFKGELKAAIEEIEAGEETPIPLQMMPSYWELEDNKEVMVDTLLRKLRVTPQSDKPVKRYRISDSPSGEEIGGIEVKVFATNDPKVFLGQYTDSNGDTDWVIRPLEGEE